MKNILLTLACVLSLSKFAMADAVDPVGEDAWKSIVVTVVQLDKRGLPNVPDSDSYIQINFGDKTKTIMTSESSVEKNAVAKLTVPKASVGDFHITYYGSIDSDYGDVEISLASGEVTEGVKHVEIRLKRVDVYNMKVTRQDGSTYIATDGNVSLQTGDGALTFATGLGFDLPVGRKYTASVSAQTEDGVDSYDSELDFTKL